MAEESLFGNPDDKEEQQDEEKGTGLLESIKAKLPFTGNKQEEDQQEETEEDSGFEYASESGLSDYRDRADSILEKKEKSMTINKKIKTGIILFVEIALVVYVVLGFLGFVPLI